MRTLSVAPLSIGLVPKYERSEASPAPAPRMLLDTSQAPVERRLRARPRPAAPAHPTDVRALDSAGVNAALLKLQDLFFASCIDYPSDEQLQQRMHAHCTAIENRLRPEELRAWRSGRDCLLARLGFQLLPE